MEIKRKTQFFRAGKRVLYTGGTFDLFHFGHQNFLRQCKLLADKVVVSLNTDKFVEKYKKNKPILTFEERKMSLEHSQYVDEVIENWGGENSKPAILSANPDIIAIGDDWVNKDYFSQMTFSLDWLEQNNIVLVYIPYTNGISTTEIKNRL